MTVKQRIETLERQIFMLNMIDMTTYRDRELLEKAEKELKELKEKNEA